MGHYIDKWAGTEAPWFTIAGLIAGVAAGISLLIRMLKSLDDGK